MTFLDPMTGLIAAGIGAPIILLLYFLKLRRQPLRVSSTLLWERAVHDLQVNAPFRMLRPTWLLLLQLLILTLVAGALARPSIRSGLPARSRAVILIDASASMQAIEAETGDPPETRLEIARRRAGELVERLLDAGGTQVVIVSYALSPNRLTGFTEDRATLREAIGSIRATDQPGDLAAALRLVEALAEPATREGAMSEPLTVILLSDGGDATSESFINAPIDFRYLPIGRTDERRPANVGIVALSARRDWDDPTLFRVFASVQADDPGPEEVTLRLSLDGRLEQFVKLDLSRTDAPGEAQAPRAGLRAASHTFDVRAPDGGVVIVSLDGADPLSSDDVAAVVLDPPIDPRVLLVGPGPEGRDADPFLLRALSVMRLEALEVIDIDEYRAMAGSNAEGVERFDLIIFDRTSPDRSPSVATMHIGRAPGIEGIDLAPVESRDDRWTRVLAWERAHPLLRYVALDSVVIAPPMRLEAEEGSNVAPPSEETLAIGSAGPLISLLEAGGFRRLILAFELRQTNWGPESSFVVFMTNVVDYLSRRGEAEAGRLHTTADPLSLRMTGDGSEIRLDGPESLVIRPQPADSGTVTVGPLRRAGVYLVSGAAGVDRIAVNVLDPSETSLGIAPAVTVGGSSITGVTRGAGAPQEIWHWFVAAAIGLLTLEWVVYAIQIRV